MTSPVKLTKRVLDSITCPPDKPQVRVYDASMPAFGVTVSRTGRKSFFVEYVPPGGGPGRRRRLTLGHYGVKPTETLDDARAEARQVLGQVRQGIDPLEHRRIVQEAGSFATWAQTHMDRGRAEGRWGKRSLDQVERHLRRASDAFGHKLLADVAAAELERWRDRLHEEHGRTEANRSLTSVKACLGEAWRRGLVPSNEAAKVKSIAGEMPRTRTLSDEEMSKLLEALEAHPDPTFRVAMLWLVMTGARRSEVLRAKWGDLRLDPPDRAEWTIPAPKNKRPSVRPIPVELVAELRRLPRDSVFVVGKWPESQFNLAWRALRVSAGLPDDVHLHDLRRTAGLWIARTAGLQAAQRLLGHADIGTTAKVYTPLSVDDLREHQRQAVAKILPFRKAAGETKGDDKGG